MSVRLWTEEHRSKTLDEYVWRDPQMRAKVEEWIEEGAVPHLLLAGKSGTGKSTLAFLLVRLLGIPNVDFLYINASRERKVEDIQNKITNFISTWALNPTGIKYIMLDECESITPLAQKTLLADLETYSEVTRFICTCNAKNKIIEPLIGRLHVIDFQTLGFEEYTVRVANILDLEDVKWDFDDLESYVKVTYPNLRKCISLVQHNTLGGKLQPPNSDATSSKDYMLSVVDLFKKGKFIEGRKMLISNAQLEDYNDIYRFLYQNLDLFGNTQEQQDEALIAIKDGVVQHGIVFDPEICLAATLAAVCRVGK